MMRGLNESLRYGFDHDRELLLDITMGTQTILPLVNIILLHPAVLVLLVGRRNMRADIRIGYASTVIGFMLSDMVLFGLRAHLLSPFAGIYCGGPLCREGRVDLTIIRSAALNCCHTLLLRGSEYIRSDTGSKFGESTNYRPG
ncbi:hypothetical protein PMAYCL1PPCAC_16973, partial [Pristionchus mayeri]